MKIPVVIQMQPGENGAAALCMMLGYYKKYVSLEEMREVCICSRNGSSPQQIVQAAKQYGMEADKLIETIGPQNVATLGGDLKMRKAVDFIYENAVIKEAE